MSQMLGFSSESILSSPVSEKCQLLANVDIIMHVYCNAVGLSLLCVWTETFII